MRKQICTILASIFITKSEITTSTAKRASQTLKKHTVALILAVYGSHLHTAKSKTSGTTQRQNRPLSSPLLVSLSSQSHLQKSPISKHSIELKIQDFLHLVFPVLQECLFSNLNFT